MKKRIFAFILLVCVLLPIVLLFSSCDRAIGRYTFRGIAVCVPGTSDHVCLTIVDGVMHDTGVEVKTKEYGPIFCSDGTYILFESKCPICGETKGD